MNPGDRIGNYEIIQEVGSGAMGHVYRASQLSMNRVVALKILPDRYAKDQTFVARFIREARSAGACSHGNLIHVYEVGQADGKYFFSMEFVGGLNLCQALARSGPLSEQQGVSYMRAITSALQEAHNRKIVHRDVKPANIILDDRGEPKLADLGLAKPIDADGEDSNVGRPIGTPYYMAPEQVRSDLVDGRADLYALGATFYHLLTGQTMFTGPNPGIVMAKHLTDTPRRLRELRPDLSRDVEAIIMKLVEKAPGDRYPDAATLLEDLRDVEQHEHPRHACIAIKSASGRRATATKDTLRVTPVVSARRGTAFYAVAGAVPIVLIMIAVYALTRADPSAAPPSAAATPTAATPTARPGASAEGASTAPAAGSRKTSDPDRIAELFAEAQKKFADDPDDVSGAIQRLTVVAIADEAGEYGVRAQAEIEKIEAAGRKKVAAELARVLDAAGSSMVALDFDAALAAYEKLPPDVAALAAREISEQTAVIRQAGLETLTAGIAVARAALDAGELARARAALEDIAKVVYRAGSDSLGPQIRELARRVDDAAKERTLQAERAAAAAFAAFLPAFEAHVKDGKVREARALADGLMRGAAGSTAASFASAVEVARALEDRSDEMRRAVDAIKGAGVETTLHTVKGPRKGVVQDVNEETVDLAVTIRSGGRVMGQTRFSIPWSDLTPEAELALAAEWKPRDAHGSIGLAMNAVCRGRADEAEAILKTVDAHPVKEYLAERLTALRAGPAEAAARSAWQRLEPRTHGTPSEARAKAVLAELETYLKEHGSTRFAASVAAAVAAAKSRCASAAGDGSAAALAAHWRFDEGNGAVASDSSGRNRHARITEGTWVRGKLGTALKLPGGASEVAPSGTDGLDMGGADFTICAWIRTTQQAGTIFSKSDPGGSWQPGGKIVYIAGGRLEFDAHSVGRVDSPAVLSDGVWHHIAVGYEFGPKTLRLYADGDLVARRHIALSADVPAHVFKMGHFPRPCFGSEPYAGEIDDARFYQRLLTAGELATLAGAAAAAGPDAAAPVAVIRSGSTGAMQVFVDDVAIADRVLSAQEVASAAFGRPRPGASPNG